MLYAAMPHRPHGMNDAPGPETVSLREFCIAGLAPPTPPAGLAQFRTGCTVNGAAHTAAGKERFVGGVHDRIDVECRDVGLDRSKGGGHDGRMLFSVEDSVIDSVRQRGRQDPWLCDSLPLPLLTLITGVILK